MVATSLLLFCIKNKFNEMIQLMKYTVCTTVPWYPLDQNYPIPTEISNVRSQII